MLVSSPHGSVYQLAFANVDRPARPQQVPGSASALVQRGAQLFFQRRGIGLEVQLQLRALGERLQVPVAADDAGIVYSLQLAKGPEIVGHLEHAADVAQRIGELLVLQ